ncbi:MAG TPA: MurR/RpiR family transcriptional regulator [Anaerolineae bacterium]|nr:MurR/RpiR family transcriptional regulator [Anaerolineae bacterium]
MSGDENILLTIRGLLPSLTTGEKKIGNYVLRYPDEVVKLSITELAEACGVSDATIFRFCRKVGTEGYQDFKIALAKESVSPDSLVYTDVIPEDSLLTMAEKIVEANVKALRDTLKVLDVEALDRALNAILAANQVQIYAIGGSGVAARELQFKLMQLGINANAFIDSQMQFISASLLTDKDVGIAVSHSGTKRHTVEALKLAKASGATTICITSHPASPIAEVADIKLCTSAWEDLVHDDSPSVRNAQLALIDVIYEGIVMRAPQRAQASLSKADEASSTLQV